MFVCIVRQTGGGSADSSIALKYLGGKLTSVPGAANGSDAPLAALPVRRRRGKSARLTRVKQHRQPIRTNKVVFARWLDGSYYAAVVCSATATRTLVKFRDGITRGLSQANVISARMISVGDMVDVKIMAGASRYESAMVLRYDGEEDFYLCATRTLGVRGHYAENMRLPMDTAAKMAARKAPSMLPLFMSKFVTSAPLATGQDTIFITTGDLAELNPEGWISESLVELYVDRFYSCGKYSSTLARCQILPLAFFRALSDSKHSLRSSLLKRFQTAKRFLSEIKTETLEAIFVPIFEITHWYMIMIRLSSSYSTQIDDFHPHGSKRISFSVIDSYFAEDRSNEIQLLTAFLKYWIPEWNNPPTATEFVRRAELLSVPVQGNGSDCGMCMLMSLEKYLEENLGENSARLDWFGPDDVLNKRDEMAKTILESWFQEKEKR